MNGIISQTLMWITHPQDSEASISEWLAGLIVVLILAFLWATVVKQIE